MNKINWCIFVVLLFKGQVSLAEEINFKTNSAAKEETQKCETPHDINMPVIGSIFIYRDVSDDRYIMRQTIVSNDGYKISYKVELAKDHDLKNAKWRSLGGVEKNFIGFFPAGEGEVSKNNFFREVTLTSNLENIITQLKLGETSYFKVTEKSQFRPNSPKSISREGKITFLGCDVINVKGQNEPVLNYQIQTVLRSSNKVKRPESIVSYSVRLGWWLKDVNVKNHRGSVIFKIEEK